MTDSLLTITGQNLAQTIFPPAVRRVLSAIRVGCGGALFPPVIRARRVGVATIERLLAGEADHACLAAAFALPRFAPLLALLEQLDKWCAHQRRKHSGYLADRVFSIDNGGLLGSLTSEAFIACAATDAAVAQPLIDKRYRQFIAFIELFLQRFQRDSDAGLFAQRSWHGPVVALETHGEETHNGGKLVLRLQLRDGTALAYKPRPADGEQLFLAESEDARPRSVFGFLNARPPASGAIRLPLMQCFGGSDRRDCGYAWQEWLAPPASMGVLRRSGRINLAGPRLSPKQASLFWHDAGALSAMCFGFGIVDLGEENLLVGQRADDDRPLAYPVDLEIYFATVTRLYETGLVASVPDRGTHHVGFEKSARWCTSGGPLACFEEAHGGLQLRLMHQAWGRTQTRNVVGDTRGHTGYAAYLPSYLRGMFDAWTMACRERDKLARFIERASRNRYTRVLLKPTTAYGAELKRRLRATTGARVAASFSVEELAQLDRHDAPYFFRAAAGGPLLESLPPPHQFVAQSVGPQSFAYAATPVDNDVRACRRFDLAGLGIALRDAVAYVYDELSEQRFTDRQHGVHVHLRGPQHGEIGFDWHEVGQRVIYTWTPRRMRLRLQPIARVAVIRPRRDLRRQLLRLDRVDGVLREPWAKSDFTDIELERQLDQLTNAAAAWFREVLDEHGWPGVSLVGQSASRAAARFAQHLKHASSLQRRCLRLLRQAAAAGEASWRDVAGLTDAIRLAQGRPQLYGSKFERVGDTLRPYPIENPAQVDQRRRQVGMEPLQRYAQRLRQRFLGEQETSA